MQQNENDATTRWSGCKRVNWAARTLSMLNMCVCRLLAVSSVQFTCSCVFGSNQSASSWTVRGLSRVRTLWKRRQTGMHSTFCASFKRRLFHRSVMVWLKRWELRRCSRNASAGAFCLKRLPFARSLHARTRWNRRDGRVAPAPERRTRQGGGGSKWDAEGGPAGDVYGCRRTTTATGRGTKTTPDYAVTDAFSEREGRLPSPWWVGLRAFDAVLLGGHGRCARCLEIVVVSDYSCCCSNETDASPWRRCGRISRFF